MLNLKPRARYFCTRVWYRQEFTLLMQARVFFIFRHISDLWNERRPAAAASGRRGKAEDGQGLRRKLWHEPRVVCQVSAASCLLLDCRQSTSWQVEMTAKLKAQRLVDDFDDDTRTLGLEDPWLQSKNSFEQKCGFGVWLCWQCCQSSNQHTRQLSSFLFKSEVHFNIIKLTLFLSLEEKFACLIIALLIFNIINLCIQCRRIWIRKHRSLFGWQTRFILANLLRVGGQK